VYVRENSVTGYAEGVTLRPQVSVYGGYSSDWLRDIALYPTRIKPALGTFQGVGGAPGLANVTLDGFVIQTLNATNGASNYGIFLNQPSAGVVLSNNVITVGTGSNAFSGSSGFAGGNGAQGLSGATAPSGER